ncbi:hypothetical protein LINPERHAP1_LOCUS2948 [Linum perenne]
MHRLQWWQACGLCARCIPCGNLQSVLFSVNSPTERLRTMATWWGTCIASANI